MNADTIAECQKLSLANTPFPVVVEKLVVAGVRTYRVDFLRLQSTYYGDDNTTVDKPLQLEQAPAVAEHFDTDGVVASLRAIQGGKIGYADWLRRVMAAGCASYDAYLQGRRVIYFGRDGSFHVEDFPQRTQ